MKHGSKIFYAILAGSLWLICACSGLSHAQDNKPDNKPTPHKIVLLTMSAAAGTHQVLSVKIVDSPVALQPGPAADTGESLNYTVMDDQGHVLVEGGLRDPQLVRSPLSPPGEPQQGHKTVSLPQSEYLLRLPYSGAMKYLRLAKGKKPEAATARELKSAAAQGAAASGTTTIDLAPWLEGAQGR